MRRIYVSGATAEFHAGVLELTPAQASARITSLDDLGDGLYQIKHPVQFKRGEELGFDGEINKAQFLALWIEDDSDQSEESDQSDQSEGPDKPGKAKK